MMTTTVVDYPVAFQVPSEYDPICDARPTGNGKWCNEKRAPGGFGVYRGWKTTQLYGNYFTSHEIRIPSLNNQNSMECYKDFFWWLKWCHGVMKVPAKDQLRASQLVCPWRSRGLEDEIFVLDSAYLQRRTVSFRGGCNALMARL